MHCKDRIIPKAQLAAIGERWEFLDSGGNAIETEHLLRWGAWVGITRNQALWLRDGSWVCGDLSFKQSAGSEPTNDSQTQVRLLSDWFEELSVNISDLRGIVLENSRSLGAWNALQREMETVSGTEDCIWFRDGRRAQGIFRVESRNQGDTFRYWLEIAGERVSVQIKDVRAIVFSPALFAEYDSSEVQRVGLRDGSLIRAESIESQTQQVVLTTSTGQGLTSLDPPAYLIEQISFLEKYSSGTDFLAERPVAQYKQLTSLSSLEWPLGIDEDVYTRPLMVEYPHKRAAGKSGRSEIGLVRSGIAMHAPSRLAYRWNGTAAKLLTELRFAQPRPGGSKELGNVNCKVILAKDGKLETVFDSPLDRQNRKSALVDVDLSGAQLIVLIVEEADFGPWGDHVLWLDCRVVTDQ